MKKITILLLLFFGAFLYFVTEAKFDIWGHKILFYKWGIGTQTIDTTTPTKEQFVDTANSISTSTKIYQKETTTEKNKETTLENEDPRKIMIWIANKRFVDNSITELEKKSSINAFDSVHLVDNQMQQKTVQNIVNYLNSKGSYVAKATTKLQDEGIQNLSKNETDTIVKYIKSYIE